MSFTLIRRIILDASANDIVISDIPQNFTDLQIVYSLRNTGNSNRFTTLRLNGDAGSNYSFQISQGDAGSSLTPYGATLSYVYLGDNTGSSHGTGVFSNGRYTIMDYTSSGRTKMIIGEAVAPNTSTSTTYTTLTGGRWSGTSAVTSIRIADGGGQLAAGSSISLYGVARRSAIGRPKATGGTISYANGYWVHTFNGSGTFTASQELDVDALIVAGGGGGGGAIGNGGGGGAGGVIVRTAKLSAGSSSLILVGAGGTGMARFQTSILSNGQNSQFLDSIAIGGGGGGGYNNNFTNAPRGSDGGSGGGAWSWASQGGVRGLGTVGQGNDGGLPTVRPGDYAEITGGGGGAGAAGGNGSSTTTGNGGDGIFWNGAYYAGGGGGGGTLEGSAGGTFGLGGLGGGGRGGDRSTQPDGSPGTANTGGGGGGNSVTSRTVLPQTPGNGGSGVVIIRYLA